MVRIPAEQTHDLRRRVLREELPTADVRFVGDDLQTTAHFAIARCEDVVAISTWLRRPLDDEPGAVAIQLRGMATDPSRRGRGLGSMLLDHGVEHARSSGAQLVWARARTTALGFYLGHHFEAIGPEYIDVTTQIPHQVVRRRLG